MSIMRKHGKQNMRHILVQVIFDDLSTTWMDELELGDVQTVPLIENVLLESRFTFSDPFFDWFGGHLGHGVGGE